MYIFTITSTNKTLSSKVKFMGVIVRHIFKMNVLVLEKIIL